MRRFGNVPNLEKKYIRRPGVYAILTRGDQILLTYQEAVSYTHLTLPTIAGV